MRLNLAQALMCRSDLLLLDEPTNHLDLDAVIWLEAWLRDYRGTLLLISHDREFLDACVTHIAHIERGRIGLYTGGYSDFERQRGERLIQQQAMFEAAARHRAPWKTSSAASRRQGHQGPPGAEPDQGARRMERIAARTSIAVPFSFAFRMRRRRPIPAAADRGRRGGLRRQDDPERITLTLRPASASACSGAQRRRQSRR